MRRIFLICLCAIACSFISCNHEEPDTEVYEVAGNIYRYSNEDEFDLNSPDAADKYNGKTIVSYMFDFRNPDYVYVEFDYATIKKVSEDNGSTIWTNESFRCDYKRENMNDIHLYNASYNFYVKARKDHIIYNGMVCSLYKIPISIGE